MSSKQIQTKVLFFKNVFEVNQMNSENAEGHWCLLLSSSAHSSGRRWCDGKVGNNHAARQILNVIQFNFSEDNVKEHAINQCVMNI